jgi:hypothetical protein
LKWVAGRPERDPFAWVVVQEEVAAEQAVRQFLRLWQQDTGLVSVRDKEALDRLLDGEREVWRKLWTDVDALLKKVAEKP